MPRGGKRKGVGRPKGTGKFGETTKAVRLPISMIDDIVQFIKCKGMALPLYSKRVQAGFPAPADDIPAERFSMIHHLIQNPLSTFYVRLAGEAMTGAGIHSNDILVVDKGVEPKNGDVVVVVINGEFTVRRFVIKNKKIELKPENAKFATIKVQDEEDLNLWGVVKNVIHAV